MVSRFSLPVGLVFLIYASTSAALNSSQVASPSYPNTTLSSSDVAAADTTTVYVSDSAGIASCLSEWSSWFSTELIDFVSEAELLSLTLTTISFETTTSTVYSTYVLCDGIPRIVIDGPLNYTMVTVTEDYVTPKVIYSYESALPPSPVVVSTFVTSVAVLDILGSIPSGAWTSTYAEPPTPTCQIDASDCASLYAASSNAMFTGGGINTTASPPLLACDVVFLEPTASQSNYPCFIEVPIVQLIYWPVTLASQDLCVFPDPIDITATQSTTPIASMFGMNVTSDGNCYLSYPIAIAYYLDGPAETEPGGIVTVASSNLLSFRNSQYGYANLFTYSFNFADLPPNHVPVLAYEGGLNCNFDASYGLEIDSMCTTIYEELYTPQLSFPTEFMKKFPQWESCDFNFLGLYDPPTSLVPVDFLTPPSTAIPTTGAYPGKTNDPITPSQTPIAVTQTSPPTTSTPEISNPAPSENDGTGFDGDSSVGSSDPPDTNPQPSTVVTFGNSGVSVAISVSYADGDVVVGSATLLPGQVTTIDGQTVSALSQGPGAVVDGQTISVPSQGTGVVVITSADPSTPAIAIFALGNGDAVTATSIARANQGSTVIDVGGIGDITVGGPAITLSSGVVLSAGSSGLVISGAGSTTTVLYSAITMATSTSLQTSTPPRPTAATAVTSTTKTGGSSRAGIGMRALVVWLLAAFGLF